MALKRKTHEAKPITSPVLIEQLDNTLSRYNESYGIVMQLIINTGIDLTQACSLNTSDLYKKDSITFRGMRRTYVMHTEPIPEQLKERINEYLKGRKPDSPAFTGSRDGGRLFPQTFNHMLHASAELIGHGDEIITSTALRKTFIYNTFLKDRRKAYTFSGAKCPSDIYKYLHLDPPEKEAPTHDVLAKEAYYTSDILQKVDESYRDAITKIKDSLKNPTATPDSYFKKTNLFLSRVDSAISLFNEDIRE